MEIKLKRAEIVPYSFRRNDLCLFIFGYDDKGQEAQYIVSFDINKQCCKDNYVLLKGDALTEKIKITNSENINLIDQYLRCGKWARRWEDLNLIINKEKFEYIDDLTSHSYINVNLQWGDMEFNIEFHIICYNNYHDHKVRVSKVETIYERIL